ncbi:hypothetical protein QJS10_CPA08g01594 [Acorus calamus]|uniref:Uncharacterized protein n=1 Tax=Acorus calamus TaxID=4465 RepID=A0AAV9EAT5_ACOCL|nr:hypothetical protein QJS10_CPA08g01594 [Acorus calamus]
MLADMKSHIPSTLQSDLIALSVIRLLIDELLLQVDAQATLIGEMENLLNMEKTLVAEKEERVTRSLLELPVWGSPRDLVAALANGGDDDNSD